MGALRGRANNPSTPKIFTLSHCTMYHIIRWIDLLSKSTKEGVSEIPTQGRGWGPLPVISCYYFFVVLGEIC